MKYAFVTLIRLNKIWKVGFQNDHSLNIFLSFLNTN